MTTIHSLTQQEISASATRSVGLQGIHTLDNWLRDLCAPYIARIDKAKEHLWGEGLSVSIPLREHGYDSQWLEEYLQKLDAYGLRANGTVLLFAGSDGISSFIRACTNSRFSHVALSITTLLDGTYKNSMIWQSYESVPCRAKYPKSATGEVNTRHGVDLSDYAKFIARYARNDPHARFVLRRLRYSFENSEELRYMMEIDRAMNAQISYPNAINLALMYAREQWPHLRAICDLFLGTDQPTQTGEYCSALASATIDKIRPFLRGRRSSDIWPGDFSRDDKDREVMDARGPLFSREVELKIV